MAPSGVALTRTWNRKPFFLSYETKRAVYFFAIVRGMVDDESVCTERGWWKEKRKTTIEMGGGLRENRGR